MKYLLIFFNRGMPHSCNGAQILTWDEKLHTDGGSIQQVFFDVKLFFSLVGDLLANLYNRAHNEVRKKELASLRERVSIMRGQVIRLKEKEEYRWQ